MRNNKIFIIASLCSVLLLSCDQNFEEMNVNPNQATLTQPEYLFNYILREGGGQYSLVDINHSFLLKWIMQSETPFGNSTYPPYTMMTPTNIRTMWENFYTTTLLNTGELIRLTSIDLKDSNKKAIAQIWRVYIFHMMTDLWGDIPYSDAIKGYTDRVLKPVYDTQEAIYTDMLKTIKESVQVIDKEKTMFTNDLLFNGDLDKWIKFANSLRLRLAIRAANGQVVTELMQENNLIAENAGNAMFKYMNNVDDWSPMYNLYHLKPADPTSIGRISALLLDTLEYFNDPRIEIYAWPKEKNGVPYYTGVPNLLKVDEIRALGLGIANTCFHGLRFVSIPDNENPLLTYPEVCFLKAEAALNGWGANTSEVEQYYNEGIKANMQYYGIPDETITSYLQGKAKFDPTTDQLGQIITQKWIALYMNGFENFAEYRRTGFPQLRKLDIELEGKKLKSATWINILDDPEIQFPQRITYPEDEIDLNSANYQAALNRQGPDDMNTKVWWAKKSKK